MMGYGYGMGAGGWIAMAIFWIGLLALIVWGVSRAFPGGSGQGGDSQRQETPEEILDRRYAAGELDRETYQEMLATTASARSNRSRPARRGSESP